MIVVYLMTPVSLSTPCAAKATSGTSASCRSRTCSVCEPAPQILCHSTWRCAWKMWNEPLPAEMLATETSIIPPTPSFFFFFFFFFFVFFFVFSFLQSFTAQQNIAVGSANDTVPNTMVAINFRNVNDVDADDDAEGSPARAVGRKTIAHFTPSTVTRKDAQSPSASSESPPVPQNAPAPQPTEPLSWPSPEVGRRAGPMRSILDLSMDGEPADAEIGVSPVPGRSKGAGLPLEIASPFAPTVSAADIFRVQSTPRPRRRESRLMKNAFSPAGTPGSYTNKISVGVSTADFEAWSAEPQTPAHQELAQLHGTVGLWRNGGLKRANASLGSAIFFICPSFSQP